MSDKPFSPSCERNRDPILAVLREYFADRRTVLEIGSGTGQHAVHFAAAMPWLAWQCSDVAENLPGIRLWLDEARLPNTPPPIVLDVRGAWPAPRSTRQLSMPCSPRTACTSWAGRKCRHSSPAVGTALAETRCWWSTALSTTAVATAATATATSTAGSRRVIRVRDPRLRGGGCAGVCDRLATGRGHRDAGEQPLRWCGGVVASLGDDAAAPIGLPPAIRRRNRSRRMAHKVSFHLPKRELGREDIEFVSSRTASASVRCWSRRARSSGGRPTRSTGAS